MSEPSSPESSHGDAQTVVVTGASGLVGTRLVKLLAADGRRVIHAVRGEVTNPADELHWNADDGTIDAERLAEADVVVHLAGAGIASKRWTESYKQKILHSRTKGTLLISETIADLRAKSPEGKPHTLICASAIGYYGDRGERELTERAPAGDGFLPEVCQQWEASCDPARNAGVRVANLRIGVVLSADGGALEQMLLPFKMGFGGKLGNGRQYMSWIALDDLVRVIRHVIDSPDLSGPVNATSPNPVTNAEFTKALGRVLNRPTLIPIPKFGIRLAIGEMADALLLASARVVPAKLTDAGFEYEYAEVEAALRHTLDR